MLLVQMVLVHVVVIQDSGTSDRGANGSDRSNEVVVIYGCGNGSA